MLAELFEYLVTPCPPVARKLGHLKESVAIGARSRRLRRAWASHLENCRAAIMDAAGQQPSPLGPNSEGGPSRLSGMAPPCGTGGRDGTDGRMGSFEPARPGGPLTALILGSGGLLDIPVEELSRRFDQVVLADLVHPLAARWRVRKLANVRMDSVDVTGALDRASALGQDRTQRLDAGSETARPGARTPAIESPRTPGRSPLATARSTSFEPFSPPLPAPPLPELYLDLNPDLVVSANLLSQLPLLPVRRLAATGRFSPEALEDWAMALKLRHLEWLGRFSGTVLLLADVAWLDGDHREDALAGLSLPAPWRTWTWNIAPRPELHRDRDVRHEIGAFRLRHRPCPPPTRPSTLNTR